MVGGFMVWIVIKFWEIFYMVRNQFANLV